MGLEAITYLNDLVVTNPAAGDVRSEGDDHLRNLKIGLRNTFPGMAGRAWRVQAKGAGYTVLATDSMTVIQATAAITLSLTAVATIGNGFAFVAEATSGAVVLDPAGAELINGAATVTISDGARALITCDGLAWSAVLLPKLGGALDVTGSVVELKSQVTRTGVISPAQIAANTNDYAPTGLSGASVARINSDAQRNLTGWTGGSSGRRLTVHNVGTFPILFKREDTGSTAANRFAFGATLGGGQTLEMEYDATSSRWRALAHFSEEPLPEKYIVSGSLEISNNPVDPANDFDIAAGAARDDSNVANMVLASALTKRIDASWVVGTNQGGLDGTESVAGTPDNDTWYHVWLIRRSDTGVVDVLFSESSTAPTMPTNYDQKHLIGVVRRETAANRKFYQDGDYFRFQAQVNVLTNGTATTDTAVTISSAVPTIAKTFLAAGEVRAHRNLDTLFSNRLVVQIAAGVDFMALAVTEFQNDNNDFDAQVIQVGSGVTEVPNTGTFNYRNQQSNTDSRRSSINIVGFKLAR